jgi:hypothetical protein
MTDTETTPPVDTTDAPETPTPALEPKAKPAADIPKLGAEDAPAPPKLGDDVEEEPAPQAEAEAEGDDTDAEPIEYTFETPEGQEAIREPVVAAYTAVLQKHRVDPEVANDILQTMLPVIAADQKAVVEEHIEKTTSQWRDELNERHGEKLADVMRLANRALAKAATPELRTFLGDSALAVNPDFIDLLAAFGGLIINDRSVKATEDPPKEQLSALEQLAMEYEAAAKRG